jgi:hypothetical protein
MLLYSGFFAKLASNVPLSAQTPGIQPQKNAKKPKKSNISPQIPLTLRQRSIRWRPLRAAPETAVVLRPNFKV